MNRMIAVAMNDEDPKVSISVGGLSLQDKGDVAIMVNMLGMARDGMLQRLALLNVNEMKKEPAEQQAEEE